jgi:ABC-2 type transport system permease protein
MAATIFPFIASNTIFDRHTAGMENPAVLAAGRFDLAFAIVWLLPLLVLAGSFDLFASERERGMAPWLLSQPIAPAHLVAAKAAARALLLALPLAAIVVATLAFASEAGPAALLQAGGLVLLYALFWLVLALLVNLVARNAAQAALGCLAAWLGLVVLLPALALGVADLAAPPVSQAERANALRAKAMQARAELRTAVAPDRVPAPNIPDSLRRRALEVERGERLIQEALQPYHAQQARRLAWLDGLRVVSPAIALQDALERLAGSDARRALRFQDQAHGFLLEVRQIVQRHLDQDRLLTVADYDRGLPRFQLREAPPVERLGALLFDAAVIALGMAALLFAAGRRLRRHATFTE